MTLARTAATLQFKVDSPPEGGLEETKMWMLNQLTRLVALQAQPRIERMMFSRAEASQPPDPAVSKPGDGMFVWAAAEVMGTGKPSGLYFYEGGVWKRVQTV